MNRRSFLKGSTNSLLGLSMRSLITGLPAAFLVSGHAMAASTNRKYAIIGQSGRGESVNGCGPGSFDNPDFYHPTTYDSDFSKVIAGRTYTADDLSNTTTFIDGPQPIKIARCFESLGSMNDDMVFFHHRTRLGIHPQFAVAKKAGGAIKGFIGRGEEELASAIAQENAAYLGTLLDKPIILSGSGMYNGNSLNTYTPTVLKELVSSSVTTEISKQSFASARNFMVDKVFHQVKSTGTPNQMRFLDEYALSQEQATDVAEKLADEVADITDDSHESQLKMAAIIFKLKLAPSVVTDYRFSGDNHVSGGFGLEVADTLNMMAAYRAFHDFAINTGIWDQCLYATVSVFGRTMENKGNGRGHNGRLSTGLMFGQHLNKAVIGGIDPNEPKGLSMPINSQNGGTDNADVSVDDSFACYAKTVMKAAGIPDSRLDVRVRDVPAVELT